MSSTLHNPLPISTGSDATPAGTSTSVTFSPPASTPITSSPTPITAPYPNIPTEPHPTLSARTSQATLTPTSLPDGCSYGSLEGKGDAEGERVIWVEFPPDSRDNPFYFSQRRKVTITVLALLYCWYCSWTASAYSISVTAMCDDIGCTTTEAQAGIAIFAWAAGIMPLFAAPISEEWGRRPVYLAACAVFFIFNVVQAVAKNSATAIVARFFLGLAGSIGTSVVGGTMADIFVPAHRGLPMMIMGAIVYFGSGIGGVVGAYLETRLGWRWVWWMMVITFGALLPFFYFFMPETRSELLLARRAAKFRKERGLADGARYIARGEVDKAAFWTLVRISLTRPIIFLFTEPIVMFFSLWLALSWSVFYVQLAGLPYMMKTVFGFNTVQVGLVYLTTCIGAVLGFIGGQFQERVYRRKVAKRGVEARLYAPMVAGVVFVIGTFITAFTAVPGVHWMGSAVGQVLFIAAAMTIYVTAFTYVSECYGSYASSAIAGQASSRNMIGGVFGFTSTRMFETMTVRWALVLMGALGTVLALVPFVAFFYGPAIRARSPYSCALMAQEREAIDGERVQREVRGMGMEGVGDLEAEKNEVGKEKQVA